MIKTEKDLLKKIKRQQIIIIILAIVLILFSVETIVRSKIQHKNLLINIDCMNKGMCIKTNTIFNECVECEKLNNENSVTE